MKRTIRRVGIGVIAFGLIAFLVYAFQPAPVPVDLGGVSRGPMILSVDEEARTRVRDIYVVSAPVTGRLLRITPDPGDQVRTGTLVAKLIPTDPSFLDVRTFRQAQAEVDRAEAAVDLARAELDRANAQLAFASSELKRARPLRQRNAISEAQLDQAVLNERAAAATVKSAGATLKAREADLESARARLLTPADAEEDGTPPEAGVVQVLSPVDGRILRILQESEIIVLAGTPLVEVGDPNGDLEILVELLSTDAVKVEVGQRVIIKDWGADPALEGRVLRVEPFGFRKISALGVEEQRVNVVIELLDPVERRPNLKHGFRVETQIVIWESDDVVRVPSSALFRDGGEWAVFMVQNGRARLKRIDVGRNNGTVAEVVSGLSDGDRVVLYPSDRVADGSAVAQRTAN